MADFREEDRPPCFGDLEKVFPLGKGERREVPPRCWPCGQRVECLKAAVNSPKARRALKEELARCQPEVIGGLAGFLRRWSRLKSQSRGEKK